jgi:hypothetical protein
LRRFFFLASRNCLDSRFIYSRWCSPNFLLLYAFLTFFLIV